MLYTRFCHPCQFEGNIWKTREKKMEGKRESFNFRCASGCQQLCNWMLFALLEGLRRWWNHTFFVSLSLSIVRSNSSSSLVSRPQRSVAVMCCPLFRFFWLSIITFITQETRHNRLALSSFFRCAVLYCFLSCVSAGGNVCASSHHYHSFWHPVGCFFKKQDDKREMERQKR